MAPTPTPPGSDPRRRGRRGPLYLVVALCAGFVSTVSGTHTTLPSDQSQHSKIYPRFQDGPHFVGVVPNVTTPVGREAVLSCVVENLGSYKVAWLRVDTQTILTIANYVITKNQRIGVSQADQRKWFLHIKDLRPSDRGQYMCQINTDPMKSIKGFLEVVYPPDIEDSNTSNDVEVLEGNNVTLRCSAVGRPTPQITWRREDGKPIRLSQKNSVQSVEGSTLRMTGVDRTCMAAYLCIASNGVPPSVSKRVSVLVQYAPKVTVMKQLLVAISGKPIRLECYATGFPRPVVYWMKNGSILAQGGINYETEQDDSLHRLFFASTSPGDAGVYKCTAQNPFGVAEAEVTVNVIQDPNVIRNLNGSERSASKQAANSDLKKYHKQTSENSVFPAEADSTNSSYSIAPQTLTNSAALLLSLIAVIWSEQL